MAEADIVLTKEEEDFIAQKQKFSPEVKNWNVQVGFDNFPGFKTARDAYIAGKKICQEKGINKNIFIAPLQTQI